MIMPYPLEDLCCKLEKSFQQYSVCLIANFTCLLLTRASGFFFCGIIDDPVPKASSISANLICVFINKLAPRYSRQVYHYHRACICKITNKVSVTNSIHELEEIVLKPSFFATSFLSMGNGVPDKTALPRGITFKFTLTWFNLCSSLINISAKQEGG